MSRVDEVRERIETEVSDLSGRLGNAAQFSTVIETNQLPQVTPAGFVLPGGMRGGAAELVTGLFRQSISESVFVVVVVRVAGDALGAAAMDEAWPIVTAVRDAVVGWGPAGAMGVFTLASAELVGSKDGALIFQIDFTLQDQLRIAR